MAERRMFAKTIIDSDAFLDMPVSARLLYYDLGMRADDDGFVNSPKAVMRAIGATKDDMNILIIRNFVIPFESGVIVITHWKLHNYIQSDRYKPTAYKEEKAQLKVLENKAYSLDVSSLDTEWIQDVSNLDTQVRLGKDNNIYCAPESHESTKNVKNDEELQSDFKVIYDLYPKKIGKTAAFGHYKQWVTKGKSVNGKRQRLTNRQIYKAVQKYIRQQRDAGQEDYQYWKNFDTLMGKQLLDYVEFEEAGTCRTN